MKRKRFILSTAAAVLIIMLAAALCIPACIPGSNSGVNTSDPNTAATVSDAPASTGPLPTDVSPVDSTHAVDPPAPSDNGETHSDSDFPVYADNDAYFIVSNAGEKQCLLRRDCPLSPAQVDALKESIEADGTVKAAVFKKLVYFADETAYLYGSTSRDPADISKACFFTLSREGESWTVSSRTSYEKARELCADIVSMTKEERGLSEFETVSAKELAKYIAVFKVFPIAFELDELPEALSMLDAVYDEGISERILKDVFYDFCMTVDSPNHPSDYSAVMLVGIRADAEHNAVYDKLLGVFEGSADNYMPLFITKGAAEGDLRCKYIFNMNLVKH